MICRRCGADVAPTKFCAKCGALLNGKRCNTCGAIMGVNEGYCAECGTPAVGHAPPPGNYGGQPNYGSQPNYGGQPNYGSHAPQLYPNQQPTALKKRPKHQTVQTGNKHIKLRGFIGSLGALAALAAMAYFYVFGDLLSFNLGGATEVYSPLLFDPNSFSVMLVPVGAGGWSLFANFGDLPSYFSAFTNITSVFSNPASAALFFLSLPALIFQLAYFIGAVLLALAALIAVIKFLVGLLSNKEYDLMMPLELGLVAYLSMFVSIAMMGGLEYLSYTSGLMIGIYAGLGALALQIILNIALAGKRFAKGGAVAKWLSNIGLLVGAVLMLLFIPFNISVEGIELPVVTLGGAAIYSLTQGSEIAIADVAYLGVLALSLISYVWILSSAAAKAGKRAARTFKFDGYADKGCLRKGVGALIIVITVAALTVLLEGEFTTNLWMFIVGGLVMFISSIINRAVLNKDQLI